ncbi:efflux RND transporter periplasmic adaptor subunit [Zavarzinia compransoris]|uniref:Efflux RND transporter periplasmic adaptor subunit n=1 Tax=Zavarzinia compransoris TaxID=1264899 RepID=A0A317E0R4_9PROT|nr:efflux RND transporter periplasmic adaptor subunit [Zavarzinia compransoris]PWR19716.1 efflux RND transporter periplasmic adaptor subunit [Zavarzinia compransoris]TDP43337.1 multidrug efflux system membrane fusion protein [Zavarzinia compransoris]
MRKSYVIAGTLAAAMALWIASGALTGNAHVAPADTLAEKPDVLPRVRVRALAPGDYAGTVVLRGRTEALRSVDVRAEVSGAVAAILVERGDRVKQGDILCRLSVRDREAALTEAEAELRQREIEYNAAAKLQGAGFGTANRLAEARALLDAARAKVTRMRLDLGNIEIRAPFDGVIEETAAEIGDILNPGGPQGCATVVDTSTILITGQVAEREIADIAPGATARARLITGQAVTGKVRFIASKADPETRTFRVEIAVENAAGEIRAGVTTEARIPTRVLPAHHVSPAILNLDTDGTIGLKTVAADGTVAFVPVAIVGSDDGGVWVTGLEGAADVIVVGQDYVLPGQKVEAARDEGEPS